MLAKVAVLLIGVVAAYLLRHFSPGEFIQIKTPFGEIKGYQQKSRDSRSYWAFKGVPYAQPPVNKLRFQPPKPLTPWEGILDARSLPPPCVQYDNLVKRHLGQEDCLYLNIFTPKLPETSKNLKEPLPVMVFVHGGSFLYGSSHFYGPEYFMDEDVILITVHYRLGILGFLNTGDDIIKGNMGLKDQVEALRFIQKSISRFGGDPSRVTVFGESAGGACVHYLMLSNQTKGLMNNVIIQSGTALSPWAFIKNPQKQAFRVGNALECTSKSSEQLLQCLQSLDAFRFSDFHRVEEEFWSEKFGPSIELPSQESRKDAFLLQSPTDISALGQYNQIPWIVGVVPHEGCILANAIITNIGVINEDWNKMSPLLDIYSDPKGLTSVRQEYFGDSSTFNFSSDDLSTFTKLVGDRHFYKGVQDSAKFHLKLHTKERSHLFLYYFNYEGRTDATEFGVGHLIRTKAIPFLPVEVSLALELLKIYFMDWIGLKVPCYGVCHADDLKYLFDQNPLLKINNGSPNYHFSKQLVSIWAHFARYSKPSSNWDRSDFTDEDSKGMKLKFYEISKSPKSSSMIVDPMDSKRMKFWDKFPS